MSARWQSETGSSIGEYWWQTYRTVLRLIVGVYRNVFGSKSTNAKKDGASARVSGSRVLKWCSPASSVTLLPGTKSQNSKNKHRRIEARTRIARSVFTNLPFHSWCSWRSCFLGRQSSPEKKSKKKTLGLILIPSCLLLLKNKHVKIKYRETSFA